MEDSEPKFLHSSFADGDVLEEDDERNRKQARRNRNIRGMLARREKPKNEVKPTAFGEVEHIAAPSSSPKSSRDGENGETGEGPPPPWLVLRDQASINLRLHEELLDFANLMRASPPELAAREAFAACIEAAAKETLGDGCEVHLFGSSSTGLNLPSADIDVTVTGVTGIRDTTAMKRIAEWLLAKGEVSKIEIVQSARVPVAKLQQRSTGLWCDVIVNRLDGIETSKFIRDNMEIFPALSPLVLFLKLFLLQRGLHETFGGGLGSYLLVCLVLSFLQRHPSARNVQSHPKTTLGNLLFDLFRHYGQEFRYGSVGISLLNGGSLFDRAARGFTATTRTGQATLCLESPCEPGVDIGARCHKIGVVRASFNHAYHTLSSLFLTKQALGPSLLCPLLVNGDHDVVKNRYAIFKEQPAPLLELAPIPDSDEEEEEAEAKRRKLNGSTTGRPTAAEAVDENELARRAFEMMMEPVDLNSGMIAAPPMAVAAPPMRAAAPLMVAAAPAPALIAGDNVEDAELQLLEGLEDEDVCACGEIFAPGKKFCSNCGAKCFVSEAPPPAHAAFAVADPDAQLEAEAEPSVMDIVGEDEDNLDEAGIFLQAMAEVQEAAGRSPSVSSPLADDAFAYGSPMDSPFPNGMGAHMLAGGSPGVFVNAQGGFVDAVSGPMFDASLGDMAFSEEIPMVLAESPEALLADGTGLAGEDAGDPFTEDFVSF